MRRKRHGTEGGDLSESEPTEQGRLRKEKAQLKMNRAFLKNAFLFLAQEASDMNGKFSN